MILRFSPVLLAAVFAAAPFHGVWGQPVSAAVPVSSSRPEQTEPQADKLETIVPAAGEQDDQFFTLNFENDSLTSQSDRHYTNGLRLSYFDAGIQPPEFTRALADWLPFFEVSDKTGVVFSVGQNLYSPRDISQPVPSSNDRPYAGFLYGSMGLATLKDDHVDELELTLGVVGPAALGRQTQRRWHETVGATKPMGWDHQLDNEPVLMLALGRRWPEWYMWQGGGWYLGGGPSVGATVGNVYTYASTGFNVRFGPEDARWQDTPVTVRPAMPGTGYFAKPDGWFSWYLFAGANGRAVARNIFLDGNTFTDSPSVDKKIFVGDLNAGVAVTFGKVRVTFANVYRSKEFETQQKQDIFSTVNVGYRF